MAFTKIINPSGWNFDRHIAMPIPYGSRGVSHDDASDFLKSASAAPEFMRMLDGVKLAADEVPVHLVALGASEFYGPNRNGDGFSESDCRKYHDTFVKHAKFYRNHKNRGEQGDPYYGYVKASAYNEKMKRVELLAILNGSEKVASRNGGFLADKELEKIARGDDIPVSMACKVAFDVCCSCGNKARTRAEYCDDRTCKAGGCRHNLTKVGSDGHVLFVDNPNPHFFDISNVFKPADRIAYGCAADYMSKAASAGEYVPGAELAELLGVYAPIGLGLETMGLSPNDVMTVKLAETLARIEPDAEQLQKFAHAFSADPLTESEIQRLGRPGTSRSNATLAAMADHKVILSFDQFAQWHGYGRNLSQEMSDIFTQMLNNDAFPACVQKNSFDLSDAITGPADDFFAQTLSPKLGLSLSDVTARIASAKFASATPPSYKPGFQKSASANTAVSPVVTQYALYKLAALCRAAGNDDTFRLTALLAVAQNKF